MLLQACRRVEDKIHINNPLKCCKSAEIDFKGLFFILYSPVLLTSYSESFIIIMNKFIKIKCEVKMPKIIENIREQLLKEAKKQVIEYGYEKTTIRSVAQACGIGIGTVYNYFESKDMLIASFMVEDWNHFLESIEVVSSDNPKEMLKNVVLGLSDFMQKHRMLFCDPAAVKVYGDVFAVRHKQLREQLAHKIRPACQKTSVEDKDFLAEWIAEALLTWTVAGKDFEDQYKIIIHLIK